MSKSVDKYSDAGGIGGNSCIETIMPSLLSDHLLVSHPQWHLIYSTPMENPPPNLKMGGPIQLTRSLPPSPVPIDNLGSTPLEIILIKYLAANLILIKDLTADPSRTA